MEEKDGEIIKGNRNEELNDNEGNNNEEYLSEEGEDDNEEEELGAENGKVSDG